MTRGVTLARPTLVMRSLRPGPARRARCRPPRRSIPGGAAGVPDRARRRHHPVTVRLLDTAIERARAERAQALVVLLDTPGGLERSMRSMVQSILNADIPVIVYVAPDRRPRGLRGRLHHDGRACRRHGAGHQHRRGASGRGGRRPDGQGDVQEGGERRGGLRALDRHRARPQRGVGGEGGALVRVGHRARGGEAQDGGPGRRQRARSPRQDRRPGGEDAGARSRSPPRTPSSRRSRWGSATASSPSSPTRTSPTS